MPQVPEVMVVSSKGPLVDQQDSATTLHSHHPATAPLVALETSVRALLVVMEALFLDLEAQEEHPVSTRCMEPQTVLPSQTLDLEAPASALSPLGLAPEATALPQQAHQDISEVL